jgi:hypothetical protein
MVSRPVCPGVKHLEVDLEITLRPTVNQSVCLGIEPTLRPPTRYCFLLEGCYLKVAVLFLWGAVQWLNGPSHAERGTMLYCLVWFPQPGGADSHIYIPQEQGGSVLPPGTGLPLRRLLRLTGLGGSYSNPPPTWKARSPYMYIPQEQDGPVQSQSQKAKLHYDRRSVNQYVLVPSPWGFRRDPSEWISIRHQEGYKSSLVILRRMVIRPVCLGVRHISLTPRPISSFFL